MTDVLYLYVVTLQNGKPQKKKKKKIQRAHHPNSVGTAKPLPDAGVDNVVWI